MTLERLASWLDAYGRAWEDLDPEAFLALFTNDAVYRWGPSTEPLRGREEVGSRLRRALATQEQVRFGHEPLAVTPDGRGLCRWWASIRAREASALEETEGVFLVTFDADGRCTHFREWWNSRSVPIAS